MGLRSFVFLLLLLGIFLFHVEADVNFHFSGYLFCNKPTFQYHMTLYEDDVAQDDVISNMPPVSSHYPHFYKIDGKDDLDGCLWPWWPIKVLCDRIFEVYVEIVHNCTPDGSNRKMYVDFGRTFKENEDIYKTININVTNHGDQTTDVIDFSRT